MNANGWMFTVILVTACGSSGDQVTDGSVSIDSEPGCTASTEDLPLDALVANLETTGDLGAIARAKDGTVYFVSYVSYPEERATVGRRPPCGSIEAGWLEITAPVDALAVASDNVLYLAASGLGTAQYPLTARLYALDLTDPNGFPVNLVRDPGERIVSLSAGANGALYFMQAGALRVVNGDQVSPKISLTSTEFPAPRAVAARHDGTLIASSYSTSSASRVARVELSGTTATVTPSPSPNALIALHADASGGYYGVYRTGTFEYDFHLIHATSLGATPTEVSLLSQGVLGRFDFNVDRNPRTAIKLGVNGDTVQSAKVSLPVAAVLF